MKIDTHNPSPRNCYRLYWLSSIVIGDNNVVTGLHNSYPRVIAALRVLLKLVYLWGSASFIANKANLLSITFFAEIKTKQEKSIISMKINNIDDNRWKSTEIDENRYSQFSWWSIFINQLISITLIDIDYIDYWFSSIGHAGTDNE